jgi:uncharacterized protein YoaH (UPF0181 family)
MKYNENLSNLSHNQKKKKINKLNKMIHHGFKINK